MLKFLKKLIPIREDLALSMSDEEDRIDVEKKYIGWRLEEEKNESKTK